jgi:hypothetical protein
MAYRYEATERFWTDFQGSLTPRKGKKRSPKPGWTSMSAMLKPTLPWKKQKLALLLNFVPNELSAQYPSQPS